ncbi:hypothetical protein HKX48_006247 [Thoreauomyces humboldtii]|nr:hypothetical protein HKX48_006247 [Thoreauomyces humboldtii]
MDVVVSLHSSAASLHAEGKFRESYNTYIRASNAALVNLAGRVEWTNEDVTGRPDDFADLVRLSLQCIARAEEIVKSRHIHVAKVVTVADGHRPSQNVNANGNAYVPPFPEPTPDIPISAVTQQQWKHEHELRNAEMRYDAGQMSPKTDLPRMRRLLEDVRIQRSKVQELQALTESVVTTSLSSWRPDDLARQIAIIDAGLFASVNARQDLARRATRIGPGAKVCLDFNRYLERLCIHAVLSAQPSAHGEDAPTARACVFSLLISVAHLLFYQYRDVNGLCAVMRALHSPELRRLRKAWDSVPSKTIDTFNALEEAVGSDTGREHLELIAQILQYHYSGGGVLSVIPFLGPFVTDVEDLHNAYSAGMDGDKGEAMLSEIGARSLEEVLSTIELCQGVGKPDPSLGKAGKAAASRTGRAGHPEKEGPNDLTSLGVGNRALGHWLLTRVYWSRVELWSRSGECEPFSRDESTPAEYAEMSREYAEVLQRDALERQRAGTAAQELAKQRELESNMNVERFDPHAAFAPSPPIQTIVPSAPDDDDAELLALLADMPAIPASFVDLDDNSTGIDASVASASEPVFSVPDAGDAAQDRKHNPEVSQSKGFDYMDNYLGSLNEPFPGSNMEVDLTPSSTPAGDYDSVTPSPSVPAQIVSEEAIPKHSVPASEGRDTTLDDDKVDEFEGAGPDVDSGNAEHLDEAFVTPALATPKAEASRDGVLEDISHGEADDVDEVKEEFVAEMQRRLSALK